ncbi:MAG: hypothetical protein A2X08_03185 [Bacteroidetes bacterium GWA2_32_17]|nr:MAG: hypothetical protein A2X08_03185 [Bacteroidetes bacterium GWA2_32_17]
MRKSIEIHIENVSEFQNKLILFSQTLSVSCILNSNDYYKKNNNSHNYHSYNLLVALGSIDELVFSKNKEPFNSLFEFYNKQPDWVFGHFNYDLKYSIENLKSENQDLIGFEEMFFFKPRYVIELNDNKIKVWFTKIDNESSVKQLINNIQNVKFSNENILQSKLKSRISKEEYIDNVELIKKHIQLGDIYEMNFCQEFFNENVKVNPATLYIKLCEISPVPFSCFYKVGNKFLCGASPERFLKKVGSKIISQPIKGTSKKGRSKIENSVIAKELFSNEKERSENIMIVDLVRNDLSRTAKKQSVKVEELCGIYEFPQVFQMVSTVTSELSDNHNFTDVIKNAFPMGSMTGAPKIRAMELIEKYEKTKRGLYSGSVGYVTPSQDFDFNVVIRSFQYNAETKYLSFITGGAITIKSYPEKEYEECLIKAKGLLEVLNGKIEN